MQLHDFTMFVRCCFHLIGSKCLTSVRSEPSLVPRVKKWKFSFDTDQKTKISIILLAVLDTPAYVLSHMRELGVLFYFAHEYAERMHKNLIVSI